MDIDATTRTADRTGVEMEALTSVVAAGLALYDMVKAVDRGARLTDVRLLAKAGGRSGEWTRLMKVAVITCSNRSAGRRRAPTTPASCSAGCSTEAGHDVVGAR